MALTVDEANAILIAAEGRPAVRVSGTCAPLG